MKKRIAVLAAATVLCFLIYSQRDVDEEGKEKTRDADRQKACMESEKDTQAEALEEFIMEESGAENGGRTIVINDNNYSEAVSPEDIAELKKKIRKYCRNKWKKKVTLIQLAEDSKAVYQDYPEYKPGCILCFIVGTVKAGKDVKWLFVFVREDGKSPWKRIDEKT